MPESPSLFLVGVGPTDAYLSPHQPRPYPNPFSNISEWLYSYPCSTPSLSKTRQNKPKSLNHGPCYSLSEIQSFHGSRWRRGQAIPQTSSICASPVCSYDGRFSSVPFYPRLSGFLYPWSQHHHPGEKEENSLLYPGQLVRGLASTSLGWQVPRVRPSARCWGHRDGLKTNIVPTLMELSF